MDFFTKKIMVIELISATGKQSFEKLDFRLKLMFNTGTLTQIDIT